MSKKIEYGDFQTPQILSDQVCSLLCKKGLKAHTIIEPTAGLGAFVISSIHFFSASNTIALEINESYVKSLADKIHDHQSNTKVLHKDFFQIDWNEFLSTLSDPILFIGNPPWVTNSVVSSLKGNNVPEKSNFQNFNGLDALMGKSNFDISEWMLMQICKAMNGKIGYLAMLVKNTVARKVLTYCWKNGISVSNAEIRNIDAFQHFGASVNACLFFVEFGNKAEYCCKVYSALDNNVHDQMIGFVDDTLVSDFNNYNCNRHIRATKVNNNWRSGIKHDASKIMELTKKGEHLVNGYNQVVDIEDTFLYPLMKSSDIANNRLCSRFVIVTQSKPNDDTSIIEKSAPKTWEYLCSHGSLLDERASAIYKKRPRFSIFGIGEYSFAPYKIAISGFYNKLEFSVIETINDKPIMVDDTVYFIPFYDKDKCLMMAEILNSKTAKSFLNSLIFWDSKRSITKDILEKCDLNKLLEFQLASSN